MSKISLYIKESYNELTKKVSWPSWAELQSNAAVAMVATVIFALLVLVMDLAFKNIMTLIYNVLI